MDALENTPKVFISYSWDDETHMAWVKDLAIRLRGDGVDITLDQWHVRLGDQLPAFMEQAIRENDFVLIICTPKYKAKSEGRIGGSGYEGDVIQGEAFILGNHRKFIPVLRRGAWIEAAPSQLLGKAYISLQEGADYHRNYQTLLRTLYAANVAPPAIGAKPDWSRPLHATIQNRDLRGHAEPVDQVAITEDGSRVVSVDHSGQLRVWDTATGACLTVLSTGTSTHTFLALAPNGSRAIALDAKSHPARLAVYSLDSELAPIVLEDDEVKFDLRCTNWVSAVAVTPDWRIAATGTERGELAVWDLETAVKIQAIQAYDAGERKIDPSFSHYMGGVGSIFLSRDGTRAFTFSNEKTLRNNAYDSRIKVWDLAKGSLLKGIPAPDAKANWNYGSWTMENDFVAMCMTFDESSVITRESWKTIKVWDIQSGEIIRLWPEDASSIGNGIAVSRENILATTDYSNIRIWDYTSGQLLDTRRYHSGSINSLCISSDSKVIVSGSNDKTVMIRRI